MESIETAARRLREAYGVGQVQPLRAALDPLDATKAYAIQAANTKYWTSQGRRVIGRKVGLTAKAVQAQLGVDQPDFGVLFADRSAAACPQRRTFSNNVQSRNEALAHLQTEIIIGRFSK